MNIKNIDKAYGNVNFTAKSICFADIQFKTRHSITTGVKEIGQRTKKKMTKGIKKNRFCRLKSEELKLDIIYRVATSLLYPLYVVKR